MELTKDFAEQALREALQEGTAAEFGGSRSKASDSAATSAFRSPNEQNAKVKLHGAKPPNYEVQVERPEHLVIAYMAAGGMSQREIAQRQNVTEATISNLFRQDWFRDRVTDIIVKQGEDAVGQILRGAAVDAAFTIIDLSHNAKSETVKYNSAVHILDRHLGKAAQPLRIDDGKLSDPVLEEARLQRELEQLDAAEKKFRGEP